MIVKHVKKVILLTLRAFAKKTQMEYLSVKYTNHTSLVNSVKNNIFSKDSVFQFKLR